MSATHYIDDKITQAPEHEDVPPTASKGKVDAVMAGNVHNMSLQDRQTALELAKSIDPGPGPWTWRSFKFYMIALVVCLCSGDNGFDGTVMSSVNSMTPYLDYFGLSSEATSGTGLIVGIITVGGVVSFFPASYLPDKIGRRWTMLIGNVILTAGSFLAGFAHSKGELLGGRFLVGFGGGIANNASKPYLAEICSPLTRGRWMGLLNSFYYVGQILATGISIPFGKRMTGNVGWRAPLVIQAAPALINAIFIMFLPESPRWLYAHGEKEKAATILADLHSLNRDVQSPVIQLEMQEIEEYVSTFGADKRWWDFRQLFKTRANRYRWWLAAIVACWGQTSGNGLITYYLPVLLNQAGIKDTNKQRELTLVNSVTSFIGALTGTALVDHVGRRSHLLFGSISCTIGMAIVAGLLSSASTVTGTSVTTNTNNTARTNAGITFIFLFMVFFSYGYTPLQALYPTELFSYENRAKGLALNGWVSSAVSLINTFGLPSALQHLTWKTYLIFMAWDIVSVVLIYFFAVETRQLSLEDLDEVFESPNPKKTSLDLVKDAKVMARKEEQERGGV